MGRLRNKRIRTSSFSIIACKTHKIVAKVKLASSAHNLRLLEAPQTDPK